MNKLILQIIIALVLGLSSQEALSHSETRTAYGRVECLDYQDNPLRSLAACRTHISQIGPEPSRPRRTCDVEHTHDTSGGGDNDQSFYDTDGDGLGDTTNEHAAGATPSTNCSRCD